MALTVTELTSRYPQPYHMASLGAWPSIRTRGLLSTHELVNLFGVPEPLRTQLLTTRRPEPSQLNHSEYGQAILRDQKPMSDKNLKRCLVDCDLAEWYKLLNERVFFWLCEPRLITLMSAGEYRNKAHTILRLDSARLVGRCLDRVALTNMNTGNTRPFPHKRGPHTFRSLDTYEYEHRRKLSDYSAIVELTVIGGVSADELDHSVVRVEHAEFRDGAFQVRDLLFER